jgi:transposase
MASRHKVTLTKAGREELTAMTRKGKSNAARLPHARALPRCDTGGHGGRWKASAAPGVSARTIGRIKRRFVEEGIEAAPGRKRAGKPREVVFGGRFEARLTRLACSQAPEGRARWTMRLPAEKLVELKIVESVSTMTVQKALKKTNRALTWANTGKYRPGPTRPSRRPWRMCPPPTNCPGIRKRRSSAWTSRANSWCGEVRTPVPAAPGHGQLIDHEHMRNGVASLFVKVGSPGGRRHVEITAQRARRDFAHFIKAMIDERHPRVTRIRLVMDNLNTRGIASLHETVAPAGARRPEPASRRENLRAITPPDTEAGATSPESN